ncbi:hypothetical protein [Acinetobacter sp. P1(2025)]|uniref:hypothetical protein n=1 Tax=Acinetobacter sp. P1(2025) TaxID=3446120 RepID=UPI003F53DEFB
MRKLLTAESAKKQDTDLRLSFNSILTGTKVSSPVELERALRMPRSKKYLEYIKILDTGTHHSNKTSLQELKENIQKELPEAAMGLLIGIVSKCYLGAPYEVHTLDFFGQIIEHYKVGESMKSELERARTLAKHHNYMCIEVYSDRMVAISDDGTAAIINK